MSRHHESETEAVNADSFLDIVASIVSIMIIMVLMTGLKIKHGPVTAAMIAEAAKGRDRNDLAPVLATEQSLRGDVVKLMGQMGDLQRLTGLRRQQRDTLAVAVAALEQQTEASQRDVSTRSQAEVELGRQVADARAQLEEVNSARTAIENAPAPTVAVESYPTPLGRTVDDHEIHFQLRGSRLAYIPLETLQQEFQSDAQHKIYRLRNMQEITETVGPEGGFRMRYTLERVDPSAESGHPGMRGGTYARLRRWTLIPESDGLGETIDDALKDASELRRVLSERRTRGATVTVWTYPDSFDAFRRLRRELYRLDFPVACRPLPEGTPIMGSPEGSKSSAE